MAKTCGCAFNTRTAIIVYFLNFKDPLSAILAAKPKLKPECYEEVLKTICIMSVLICTADRYAVKMFGADVCREYLNCALAEVGDCMTKDLIRFRAWIKIYIRVL